MTEEITDEHARRLERQHQTAKLRQRARRERKGQEESEMVSLETKMKKRASTDALATNRHGRHARRESSASNEAVYKQALHQRDIQAGEEIILDIDQDQQMHQDQYANACLGSQEMQRNARFLSLQELETLDFTPADDVFLSNPTPKTHSTNNQQFSTDSQQFTTKFTSLLRSHGNLESDALAGANVEQVAQNEELTLAPQHKAPTLVLHKDRSNDSLPSTNPNIKSKYNVSNSHRSKRKSAMQVPAKQFSTRKSPRFDYSGQSLQKDDIDTSLFDDRPLMVQCDKCEKWRFFTQPLDINSNWYCSMNTNDPDYASCSAPEEDYSDYYEIKVDNDAIAKKQSCSRASDTIPKRPRGRPKKSISTPNPAIQEAYIAGRRVDDVPKSKNHARVTSLETVSQRPAGQLNRSAYQSRPEISEAHASGKQSAMTSPDSSTEVTHDVLQKEIYINAGETERPRSPCFTVDTADNGDSSLKSISLANTSNRAGRQGGKEKSTTISVDSSVGPSSQADIEMEPYASDRSGVQDDTASAKNFSRSPEKDTPAKKLDVSSGLRRSSRVSGVVLQQEPATNISCVKTLEHNNTSVHALDHTDPHDVPAFHQVSNSNAHKATVGVVGAPNEGEATALTGHDVSTRYVSKGADASTIAPNKQPEVEEEDFRAVEAIASDEVSIILSGAQPELDETGFSTRHDKMTGEEAMRSVRFASERRVAQERLNKIKKKSTLNKRVPGLTKIASKQGTARPIFLPRSQADASRKAQRLQWGLTNSRRSAFDTIGNTGDANEVPTCNEETPEELEKELPISDEVILHKPAISRMTRASPRLNEKRQFDDTSNDTGEFPGPTMKSPLGSREALTGEAAAHGREASPNAYQTNRKKRERRKKRLVTDSSKTIVSELDGRPSGRSHKKRKVASKHLLASGNNCASSGVAADFVSIRRTADEALPTASSTMLPTLPNEEAAEQQIEMISITLEPPVARPHSTKDECKSRDTCLDSNTKSLPDEFPKMSKLGGVDECAAQREANCNPENALLHGEGSTNIAPMMNAPLGIMDECHIHWKKIYICHQPDNDLPDTIPIVIWGLRPRLRTKVRKDVEGLSANDIEYYIHLKGTDSKLDRWVTLDDLDLTKLRRMSLPKRRGDNKVERIPIKKIDKVVIGGWETPAWYESSFPQKYECDTLHICEYCLAHSESDSIYRRHKWTCRCRCPPGNLIYLEDNIMVFEVIGQNEKDYCQRLCLLSKLFLENKTICYDVKRFKFYVLTELDVHGASFVGFFSKETHSADGHNVACIMTLPQHQKKGYGKFLISLSYELTKRETKEGGSPEKPLSPLGLQAYTSYWKLIVANVVASSCCRTGMPLPDISARTGMSVDDIETTVRLLGGSIDKFFRAQIDSEVIAEYTLERNKRVLLIRPECIDWHVIQGHTGAVRETDGCSFRDVEQHQHGIDDGTVLGCDGITYSTTAFHRKIGAQNSFETPLTEDPGAEPVDTDLTSGDAQHPPDVPYAHWLCLGGSDIPELGDDDSDYSVVESEADDEQTLDHEEQLPRDICPREEIQLLGFQNKLSLKRLCQLLNLPATKQNEPVKGDVTRKSEMSAAEGSGGSRIKDGLAVSSSEHVGADMPERSDVYCASEPLRSDELESVKPGTRKRRCLEPNKIVADRESSFPINKLTVRHGGTIMMAVLRGEMFDQVQEYSDFTTVTFNTSDDSSDWLMAPPTLASEKSVILLRKFFKRVQAGFCEDAVHFATDRFSVPMVEKVVARKTELFRRRIHSSVDFAFLIEPMKSKTKDKLCRLTARNYESLESDPREVILDNDDRVETEGHDESLNFQPIMRRIPPSPLVPYEECLDFEVWRTRNTYCELVRLKATLSFFRRLEEESEAAAKRSYIRFFMAERFPQLTDEGEYRDREDAMRLLAANKDRTIQSIGLEAWKQLFPEPTL
ncbi:hypothetical protein MPSEU_000392000 [Mayamaea pseudoterrestris]|nr:hypothetical protein MPSEU_000392000 [Mayamaea pseudoterrestris]